MNLEDRSRLPNFLEFFHEVYLEYDNNKAFYVIYLDFRKVFDTVPHEKLMIKVRALGIGFSIATWIEKIFFGFLQNNTLPKLISHKYILINKI